MLQLLCFLLLLLLLLLLMCCQAMDCKVLRNIQFALGPMFRERKPSGALVVWPQATADVLSDASRWTAYHAHHEACVWGVCSYTKSANQAVLFTCLAGRGEVRLGQIV
mmetsp:Transcript_86383/g.171512  ORF Transcript_86383/g.171512 Transcript_86383/m.171512 type:complete len:108 (+) Transcript_86383:3323-3646(+)